MCRCKWLGVILAIVVFVLALWPQWLGVVASKWILVVVAIVLLLQTLLENSTCGTTKSKKSRK